jgi:hypothetical protein
MRFTALNEAKSQSATRPDLCESVFALTGLGRVVS